LGNSVHLNRPDNKALFRLPPTVVKKSGVLHVINQKIRELGVNFARAKMLNSTQRKTLMKL